MSLASFRRLRTELGRLNDLIRICDFAFKTATCEIQNQIRQGRIALTDPVFLPSDPTIEVSNNYYMFFKKLKSQLPRYIRETIFVRLISTFELFLVDLVRDVFMNRTDIFHNSKIIELTHAEVLSIESLGHLRERIISKEIRRLHSSGIKEIAKYYERIMGIKFPELLNRISRLWEMHDRRHLLVHRLGRADHAYRKKYSYTEKVPLSVDNSYLSDSIAIITEFVNELETKIHTLLAERNNIYGTDSKFMKVEIEVETVSEDAEKLLRPSYPFLVNDRLTGERSSILSDILAYSHHNDGGRLLVLSGDHETVRAYLREVKRLEKKDLLTILRLDIHGMPNGVVKEEPPTTLDRHTIEEIARRLPIRPWPKGIHKKIAQTLSISNNQCSRAITAILKDESLLSLGTMDNK